MPSLITTRPLALKILMDEDIYNLKEDVQAMQTGGLLKESVVPAVVEQPASIEKAIVPAEIPQAIKEAVIFNYLGENNKYLLVLLYDEKHEFCAPKTLETLNNILKGKQMDLKDIALLNLAKHPQVDLKLLRAFFACSKIALFGINPADIGLKDIASNQLINYEGVKVLATYSFEEMLEDVAKKRIFWNEMKNL